MIQQQSLNGFIKTVGHIINLVKYWTVIKLFNEPENLFIDSLGRIRNKQLIFTPESVLLNVGFSSFFDLKKIFFPLLLTIFLRFVQPLFPISHIQMWLKSKQNEPSPSAAYGIIRANKQKYAKCRFYLSLFISKRDRTKHKITQKNIAATSNTRPQILFLFCVRYLNTITLNEMCKSLCNLHYDRKLHSICMPSAESQSILSNETKLF